jgi:hypothetical protein
VWKVEQIFALKSVASFANEKHGSVIPEEVSLSAFMRFFYKEIRKHGLIRAANMNPHALRHMLLQEFYTHVTGLPAPILGPRPQIKQNDSRVAHGFNLVTQIAGHSRKLKATAYLGSARQYKGY